MSLNRIVSRLSRRGKRTVAVVSSASFAAILGAAALYFYLPGDGVDVYAFESALHCEYSGASSRMSKPCKEAEAHAHQISSQYDWGFESKQECIPYYGKSQCYQSSDGSIRIKPAGFAYIKSTDSAVPFYHSPALGSLILPSGLPIKLGANDITFSRSSSLTDITEPLSLSHKDCQSPDIECQSLFDKLKSIPLSASHELVGTISAERIP